MANELIFRGSRSPRWANVCAPGRGHAYPDAAITTAPSNVLVYGAGAVGGVIAWRLSQLPGVRVSVVCRSNYEAVKTRGFSLSTAIWGAGHFRPHAVFSSPAEAAIANSSSGSSSSSGHFDYVLCANKSTTTTAESSHHHHHYREQSAPSPYEDLRAVVGGETTLVSLQNGVDVEAPLRRAFPRNTILSGIVYISCRQPTPGVVCQDAGIRPHAVGLGVYDRRRRPSSSLSSSSSSSSSSRLTDNDDYDNDADDARLASFLALTGHHRGGGGGPGPGDDQQLFHFLPRGAVPRERWAKQLWNGTFNPLCALSGLDTHGLLRAGGRWGRGAAAARAMAEVAAVAAAATGAPLDPGLPRALLDVTARGPPITPSMLQDVRAGRGPVEVEALCGEYQYPR
ncbi:ketopantoate reductase PanE/ApbA-domain-containing protein [Xylariaceae sp. FL0804]|nr:ketopantoate reductase PanE/ApbA-domain-containing protein [Xylariaceae sp. FL0804]